MIKTLTIFHMFMKDAGKGTGFLLAGILGGIIFFSMGSCDFVERATDIVRLKSCPELSGTPWVPQVSGLSALNHDSSVVVSTQEITATGLITGVGQAMTPSREITVQFTIPSDLGFYGSVSLVADVIDFPSGLDGWAYPVLTYLSDPSSGFDYINLARSGGVGSGDCVDKGFYTVTSGVASTNSKCKIQWPSAYTDRDHWESRQMPEDSISLGYTSMNIFPTCRWNGGSDPTTSSPKNAAPECSFSNHFFSGGKLRTGTYTAKYVLLSKDYSQVSDSHLATMRLRVVQKKDSNQGGGVDLNVILVGTENITDSRTEKGKKNLDLLLTAVYDHLNQANSSIRLGQINVVEWGCATDGGGDNYAEVLVEKLGDLFSKGSAALSATEGKALNVFLVSSIIASATNKNLTILGLSGGIGGPYYNGQRNSGLVFSSFGKLSTFNSQCTLESCPLSSQDKAFWDMGGTIAHEIGHYLGLNHPSEYSGSIHDMVEDTPICTTTKDYQGTAYIMISTCINESPCTNSCITYDAVNGIFCPSASDCQFNHLMWWTSKNFKNGSGDGNIISSESGGVINFNPFIQ